MKLGQKQELFSRLLGNLLNEAHELGYDVRMGEVLRFEQQARWNSEHCRKCKQTKAHTNHRGRHDFRAIGILDSLHRYKLAVDLILCSDGRPLWDTDSYLALGEWWEGLHELTAWGGRFNDAGHFSIRHGGKR